MADGLEIAWGLKKEGDPVLWLFHTERIARETCHIMTQNMGFKCRVVKLVEVAE